MDYKKFFLSYKKEIKKSFGKEDIIFEHRYKTSKSIFTYSTLIFFTNYFFVGARFYDRIFLKTITYIYTIFLISMVVYIYFLINYKFNLSKKYKYIIFGLLVIVFSTFLIPFLGI